MSLSRTAKIALAIYLVSLGIYAATSGRRLLRPSSDIHFAYQAQMFLKARLDLGHAPPTANDWAEVEVLKLRDGRTVSGCFLRALPYQFRKLDGKREAITDDQILSREKKYYVSFPPFPSLLFLPFVAIAGLSANDVVLTVILAAFGPALLFLILCRLRARGDSVRSESDDLWLTAMFGVGTVFYYSSVMGQVWYTAHVVSIVLCGLFILAALDVKRPLVAGILLGALVLTRPQMGFWGVFFLYELWRAKKPWLRPLLLCALPVLMWGVAGAWFNYARFHSLTEFGHFYLNVRWTDRIQRYGLFNFAFLPRNLSAAFLLTPKFLANKPFFQISWHGQSMLLTTPALIYLIWPKRREPLHTALWLCVAPIALMSFLYQNDGWVQFGYRFSIDYLLGLLLLLAVGGRPMTRMWKALIVFGIVVNLFGAITFNRYWTYYHEGFFPLSQSEY